MCWFGSCCDYHFFLFIRRNSGVVDFWRLFDLWCKQYSIKLIESEWLHEANGLYIKGDDAQCSLKIVTDTRTHIYFLKRFPHANKKCFIQLTSFKMCWYHFKWTSTLSTAAASCKKETQNTNINKMKMKVSAQNVLMEVFFSFRCYCYGKKNCKSRKSGIQNDFWRHNCRETKCYRYGRKMTKCKTVWQQTRSLNL